MSYSTFAYSEVSVYWSNQGFLVCSSCTLAPNFGSDFTCFTFSGMIAHLLKHRETGQDVNPGTLARLRRHGKIYFDSARDPPKDPPPA